MVSLIILGLVGFFFLVVGFIIWKFKIANLIAGYDAKRVKHPDKLAEWMGNCIMVTGALAWLIGIIGLLFPSKNLDTFCFIAFMVVSMISAPTALIGAQRYYE